MNDLTFKPDDISKDQIIVYMIDVLGWYSDKERLEEDTADNLWDLLTDEEKSECIEYSR